MTPQQQGALTTLLQTIVALAAIFIPGITEPVQVGILAVGAAALTAWTAFFPAKEPAMPVDEALSAALLRYQIEYSLHDLRAELERLGIAAYPKPFAPPIRPSGERQRRV